jgi:hypothetical protein
VLSESAARWLLVLHTALGAATVAAATHLVVWMRGYLRGDFARHRAVRKFAWIVLALHGGAFVAGTAMYPTYKVEVRAAFLENAAAITADIELRAREARRVAARDHAVASEGAATHELVRRAAVAARWFDIKEYWVALGLAVAAAVALIASLWDPREGGAAIAPIVVALATIEAGTVWLGAIVGVLTASWRAV